MSSEMTTALLPCDAQQVRVSLLRRAIFSSPASMLATLFLLTLFVVALLSDSICDYLGISPSETNLFQRLKPESSEHILGTDALGRDVFARVITGTKISISVGISAALCSAFLGCLIGLISGYKGGLLDRFLMRFCDTILALPLLPLLIIISVLDFTKLGLSSEFVNSGYFSLYKIIFIISIFAWPVSARLVRASTLSAKQQLYVRAAHALGAEERYIMLKHILPNVIAPLIVATTLAIGNIIILESSLSFLGLGIQPPISSWGNMLQGAEDYIWDRPMLALWPGLCIFTTVIAFNILGDAIREAYNPRSK